MTRFEEVIKKYLESVKVKNYNPDKIESCCNWIINEVKKIGKEAFTDEEVYKLARDYFNDEHDNEKVEKQTCTVVCPTDTALSDKPKPVPTPKKPDKKIADGQLTLFDLL